LVEIEEFFKNTKLDSIPESEKLRSEILNLVSKYSEITHNHKKFVPGKTPVPVSGRVFGEVELKMLVSASLDFWLTAGRFNDQFEKELAEFLGINFVTTTNSGSSANLLAISALTSEQLGEKKLQSGDEVITTAAGFPTTVNPILQNNLMPVFVDVDLSTYVADTKSVEDAITEKTKAIIFAHTLGNPFNVEEVKKLAENNGLWLIEDACDALGSKFNGKLVGTFGDIGTVSFYPAHHITMGEGGAVFTNNPELKRLIESFRDWGRDCFCATGMSNTCGKRFGWKLGELPEGYDHKFIYSHVGYNLKITDMQAAVGLAQLQNLNKFIEKRKHNFNLLKDSINDLKKYFILPEATKNSDPAWFGFPITITEEAPFSKRDLAVYLSEKKVDTRPIFAGNLTKQPYFKNQNYKTVGNLKNTDIIMNNSFWVGVYPGLTDEMITYLAETIRNFVKEKI